MLAHHPLKHECQEMFTGGFKPVVSVVGPGCLQLECMPGQAHGCHLHIYLALGFSSLCYQLVAHQSSSIPCFCLNNFALEWNCAGLMSPHGSMQSTAGPPTSLCDNASVIMFLLVPSSLATNVGLKTSRCSLFSPVVLFGSGASPPPQIIFPKINVNSKQ